MKDRSFFTTSDHVRMGYRIDGSAGAPVLVLSNSIATTLEMWDTQIADLAHSFRVIRYDTRGHGASDAPAGAYSVERLGRDVLELLDSLGIDRAHFCGLSLGGLIGQWLGVNAPERIDRLILANTSSYLGPASPWDERIASVLVAGNTSGSVETFMTNWFPERMREQQQDIVQRFRAMVLGTSAQGLAGAFAAVRDADFRRSLALVSRPTLVIAGRYDPVTVAGHGELIAATIPGAKLIVLPTVHLSNVESPARFLRAVIDFLQPTELRAKDLRESSIEREPAG